MLSLSRLARMSGSRCGFVFAFIPVVVVIAPKVIVVVSVVSVIFFTAVLQGKCWWQMCRHQKGPISDSGEWRSCFEVGLEALIVFNLIMPQGGGARHGGRQQDAVPREKVAIVTHFLSPSSMIITNSNDHLHINSLYPHPWLQRSKILLRWKKSKRLGKKFEGRAASLEVIIAVSLTFIISKSNEIPIDFYDHQNLQAESIVKERHVTEEKSSPVPNLFQLRPK